MRMRESKMPSQNYSTLQELGWKRSDAFIVSTPIHKACGSSSSSSSSVMVGIMLLSLSKITRNGDTHNTTIVWVCIALYSFYVILFYFVTHTLFAMTGERGIPLDKLYYGLESDYWWYYS